MNNSVISKELFENWLAEYNEIYVHVLPKQTTGLPKYLTTEIVTLLIGLNTAIPIPDLSITDTNWSGTLSFQRKGHFIQCPLDAVVYVVGQRSHHNTVLFERKLTKEMLDAIAPQEVSEPVSSENVVSMKDFRNRKRK
jgi:hypothetical protein